MLLVHAAQSTTEVWAAHGVVPVDIAALGGGWTLVVPSGPLTSVEPPYHEAVGVLLGRPLPHRMRPGIGVVVRGGDAVVALTPRHWKHRQRWLAWGPGEGLLPPGGLPLAPLRDLVGVSGAGPGALDELRAVVGEVGVDARTFLVAVLGALGLPGGEVLAGRASVADLPRSRHVEPEGRAVAGFEGAVHEERLWREELGS